MPDRLTTEPKRLQVGEFARTVGKTVRALHLYEELGLLVPVSRSKGGFRLYDESSVERARWIVKLQGIGFTLAQIQGFVSDFENAKTGQAASTRAGETFRIKLNELRSQIAKLQSCEYDLVQALEYLDGCRTCESDFSPARCQECTQHSTEAPELIAGLNESASDYHVDAKSLNRPKILAHAETSAKRSEG